MPLKVLHHCSIRTGQLEQTRDFFVDVLGMVDGERPAFDFPGNWLYVGAEPVVHLIGLDSQGQTGVADYMGDRAPTDLKGSGAIDHLAFNITEPDAMRKHLEESGVSYRERKVPGMELLQFFLEDPNGITIELNCWLNN